MKKSMSRKALVSSILALLLCVSMLVGTTFAWFTDEVVTGLNTIAAGNLDVELYANGEKVKTDTPLFELAAPNLWEPGVVVYENLQVANVGTLALTYQMTLNIGEENTLNGHKLSEVLQIAVIDKVETGATREQVLAAAEASTNKGALADFVVTGELKAGEKATEQAVVIFWAPNDNAKDNLYNANNGQETSNKEPLSIEVGINLQATQLMHEEDSFGKDYDALASKWDGSVGEVPEAVDNVITIYTGEELAAFAASVNAGTSYSGQTVKLGADINLNNNAWTPIGQNGDKAGFQGTFDGQGHTISNLSVNQTTRAYQSAGLFGSARYATIKNFKIVNATINNLDDAGNTSNGAAVVVGAAQFATTIDNVDVENATVTGNRRVAAIAGYYVGTITNCDVKNVNLTANFDDLGGGSYDNADKVGMIIAYSNGASTITNNTVTGGSISAYRDMGGIAGYATSSTLTDNKVNGLSIVVNTEHNYKNYANLDAYDAGEIIGEGTADATNVATNVTIGMPVTSTEDLVAAINAGETEIELTSGNYKLPNVQGKNITLIGSGTDTVVDYSHMGGNQEVSGSSFVFKNMTVVNAEAGYPYKGLQHITSVSYENCHITGTVNLFAPANFTNCTFDSKSAEHNVVTYGSDSVTFTNCDFTYGDRAVNCYAENASARDVNVTFTDCTFTKVTGKDITGAIETNSSLMNSLTLTINNCSVNEGKLWFVAGWDSLSGAKTFVTVNGQESKGDVLVQSSVLPYLTINSNSTYKLVGDFSSQNVSLKMAESVENVVFDGSNATNINELIITQNGQLIDNQVAPTGERSGNVTIQNFNVLSQIDVFACKTEVVVQSNTAEALMIYAGNCDVKVLNNTIDANFESHTTYSSATTAWNTNKYGIMLNIFDYNLWFEGNTVTDSMSHAVGINGWQSTINSSEANKIESFKDNKITVNVTNDTERAAFKVWDDVTYANKETDANNINTTAQAFIDAVLTDGSNTFNIVEGYDHTIFCFYNVNTNN